MSDSKKPFAFSDSKVTSGASVINGGVGGVGAQFSNNNRSFSAKPTMGGKKKSKKSKKSNGGKSKSKKSKSKSKKSKK